MNRYNKVIDVAINVGCYGGLLSLFVYSFGWEDLYMLTKKHIFLSREQIDTWFPLLGIVIPLLCAGLLDYK